MNYIDFRLLNNRYLFLKVLEAGKFKIKVLTDVASEVVLLIHRELFPHHAHKAEEALGSASHQP